MPERSSFPCLVFVCLALVVVAGAAAAQRGELVSVPEIDLPAAEPAVQERLKAVRRELVGLLTRSDLAPVEVGRAFGEAAQLFLLYDLSEPAQASLHNAVALDSENMRWHYLKATFDELELRLDEAAAGYRRTLELAPGFATARARLAELELQRGNLDEAEGEWQQLLVIPPFRAAALFGLGRVAAERGDAAAAVEELEKALAEQPEANLVHYHLGLAYRTLGDQEKALEQMELRGERQVFFPDPIGEEIQRLGAGVGRLLIAGRSAVRAGNFELAEQRFREAVEMDPESSAAHRALAGALSQLGRLAEALGHWDRAARLDPVNAGLQMFVAGELEQLTPSEEGDNRLLELYEAALVQAPDLLEAWLGKARALERLGRTSEAEAALTRALEIDPGSTSARLAYGGLLEALGRVDEARAQLEPLVTSTAAPEERGKALFGLANLDVAAGDLGSAVERYLEAIEMAPSLVEAQYNLATVFGRLGRYEEAVDYYARTLALQPDNHGARVGEAVALLLSDRDAVARERLESAIELYPTQPAYAHLLARVLVASPDDSVRDAARGLDLARRLFEYESTLEHAETVAMALAENGRFDEAVALQATVVERLRDAADPRLGEAEGRLAVYRDSEPVRSPWG